jgi:hypothetical protein
VLLSERDVYMLVHNYNKGFLIPRDNPNHVLRNPTQRVKEEKV